MTRGKIPRKKRAAANRAADIRALPVQPDRRDFLSDGQARFKAYVWTISLTFGYGVVNNVLLRRPEHQVNIEALIVCTASIAVHVAFFYARPFSSGIRRHTTGRLWVLVERLRVECLGHIKEVSVFTSTLVILAVLLGTFEPTVAAWGLQKSSVGLVPTLDSALRGTAPEYRFQTVSNRIERAISTRSPGDPNALGAVRSRMETVLQNARVSESVRQAAAQEIAFLRNYESFSQIAQESPQVLEKGCSAKTVPGIPIICGQGIDKTGIILAPPADKFTEVGPSPMIFTDFSVISFGHNVGSPVPQFAVARGNSTAVIFNNMKVEGMAQDIGNLTWTNVTFQGCLIRYHGDPVRMGNVRFLNSEFERSPDGKGQELMDYLARHQGETVSVYVPSMLAAAGFKRF